MVVSPLLLAPAALMIWFGIVQLRDGFAQDSAVPVPVYMIAQVPMSKAAYNDATAALAGANPRNGQATIERGEAAMRSGEPESIVAPILIHGLTYQPASARGWLLLSEVLMRSDEKRAGQVLAQALVLAPRDYWLIEPRAQDAALLWDQLDSEARSRAVDQARMLWREPRLHPQLFQFLKTPVGVAFQAKAYAGQPDEIRAMNRWIREEKRRNANEQ
jgi:hypothetical protein